MKKVISFILVLSILLGLFASLSFNSAALSSSGSCGTDVYYTFDSSTGLLTISGRGGINVYSFEYQNSIKTVVINSGVTSIGYGAFEDCSGLTSITIPDSVTSIGERAFYNCRGLKSITIPDSVTSIGEDVFYGCSSLTSVTIPNFVTSIGWYAFYGCSSLTSITIPDSVTSIGDYAFYNCTGLTSVTIGDSVTSIGERAFYNCRGLKSITIPDSVTSIVDYAFYDCSSLKSITIPNSVTSIGNNAFAYCSSLKSITIGNYVTSIGYDAFWGCSGLTSITIPDSVTSIGHDAFWGCNNINDVYYTGSNGRWKAIYIDEYNENLTNAKFHYNYNPYISHEYKINLVKPKSNAVGYTWYKCTCGEFKRTTKGNVYIDKYTSPTGKPSGLKCSSRAATSEKFAWSKTSGVSGYQLQISTKDGKKWDKTYNAKTATAYTVKGLTAGSAYKARVRFYIIKNGKNYYGAWATLTSPTLPGGTSLSKVTYAKKAFAFTAQWKKNKAVTGYQLQYSLKSNFSGAKSKAIKGASKLKLTIKSLQGGKKYFVRVRTYKTIGGKNYYSAWSTPKTVKTK